MFTEVSAEVGIEHAYRTPQDPTEAVFGLGGSAEIDRILVRWPDRAGTVTEHRGIETDQWVTLYHPARPHGAD
jgi:hypothetical protein